MTTFEPNILAYRFPPPRQSVRSDRISLFEPLELEYLYTALQEWQITPIDGMADRRNINRFIKKNSFNIILLSGYLVHLDMIRDLCAWIKSNCPPQTFVFVGGPQAEVTPALLNFDHVDGVIISSDTAIIRDIVSDIVAGRDFRTRSGLAYRDNGSLVINPAPVFDPDSLPIPERVLFNAKPQKYFNMFFRPCASIKTSYGCPGVCTYCFCRKMNGGRFSCRSMNLVMDELQSIDSKSVFILDDNFLSSISRVREFIAGIKTRKIDKNFIIYGTADFAARNPQLMQELRSAGVRWILIGFEYLSSGRLKELGKRASCDDNIRALEVCRKCDIEVTALFMVDPDWTHAEFDELEAYVKKHRIFFATYSTKTVFPGADDAEGESSGSPDPDRKWWRYDLLRLHEPPSGMSLHMFYFRMFRLYLSPVFCSRNARSLFSYSGVIPALRLMFLSIAAGIEFLIKLIRFP